MEAKGKSGRCRCCYEETTGSRELSDCSDPKTLVQMLKDTFSISLSHTSHEGNICAVCSVRLHDAASFKRMVLKTDQRFQQIFSSVDKIELEVPVDLKVEVDSGSAEEGADWDGDDDLNDPDYTDDKPLKPRISPTAKTRKSKIAANVEKALALTDRTRSIYSNTFEKLAKVNMYVRNMMEREGGNFKVSLKPAASRPELEKKVVRVIRVPRFKMEPRAPTRRLTKLKVSDIDPNSANTVGLGLHPAEKRAARKIIKQNALAILKNTTACPFIYFHSNFRCFYCREAFFQFHMLREHTVQVHNDVKQEARKINAFRDLMMVDITSLQCRRCQQEFSDIETIKEHLITAHNVAINTKHKDDIAAFKINSNIFKCHICSEEFHVFRNLSSHVNKHFANYMCDVCGKPFISWERYKNHETTHVMGNFPCSKCDQVFSTTKARSAHSISEHRVTRYGCPLCSERFEKYLERTVHMSVTHNITHKFKCPQCPKEFFHKPHFRAHMSNMHRPREKKVECPECGMRFTDNNALSRHMVSHTGEKLFGCKVCGKKYGRKYSLTEHMRVHTKGIARSRPHLMAF